MYYNKPKGFRSSVRRGDSNFNRPYSKPFSKPGGFNQQRFGQRVSGRGGLASRRSGHESKLRGQVDIFIKKAKEVTGQGEITVTNSFDDFNLQESLKINIEKKGYINPTPVQQKAVPAILEGRDLVGTANTGTGKTAAFLIPIINKILQDRNEAALIITPTRELAVQINEELRAFAMFLML